MDKYHDIEVIINNKRYTLSGYEEEEYLQKIASYINSKHMEFRSKDAYRFMDAELKNILMQINIADDYFKIVDKVKEIQSQSNMKSNEIFDLKHEAIAIQSKLLSTERELEDIRKELYETQKKVIRLETELGDSDKKR